ncbi:MAG: Gfo/Idh/MocA family oxidoreductase [Planctomycetes bacterium]|nr:Gfo/Idh/MocA family oxidoreductase [Planctomycetota bacterium]
MKNSPPPSRREFLKRTAAAGLAIAAPTFIPGRVLGLENTPPPSEHVLIGVIGVGVRSRQLIDQIPPGARVVALADCYTQRAIDAVKERKVNWPVYQDYRDMFDSEKLDAVIVGTPDHARTLPCIRAMQAGLDVYAEKPLTAYVREGRILVDAVRKHKRVFQVGTQQRTMEINRFCCEFIREGKIGKVEKVSGVNYPGPRRYEGLPEEPVPENDDWNTWCGPTELRPFNNQLQFAWVQWRDYSGGEMTNWGAHGIDQIQWALGKDGTGPTELWPDTPGPNGIVSMRYKDGPTVRFERNGAPMGGAVFFGSECKMEINRNRFATNPAHFVKDAPNPAVRDKWEGDGWIARPHIQNWLDCIKSRELPSADVEIGHRSITVCHLLNIARELGRKLLWDPEKEQFVGDDEANKLLDRPRRAGFELPSV